MTPLRQRMIEDMRVRNLSAKTIAIYVATVTKFAKFFHKSPDLLVPEEIRGHPAYLWQSRFAPMASAIDRNHCPGSSESALKRTG